MISIALARVMVVSKLCEEVSVPTAIDCDALLSAPSSVVTSCSILSFSIIFSLVELPLLLFSD